MPAQVPLHRQLARPAPDAASMARSQALADLIRSQIATEGGSIGFQNYMEMALYAPELGYYRSGAPIFGRGGDYVTAPEISPLFGECIAAQCAQILQATD